MADWLSNWPYRKEIVLSRPSGSVSDYQMLFLVGEGTGAGADVTLDYLGEPDYDGLRFTDTDGTTILSHWIEGFTGATPDQIGSVWVKIPSIDTVDGTYFMYYGNGTAANVESGSDTFLFFSDFEGGTAGDPWGAPWVIAQGTDGTDTDIYQTTPGEKVNSGRIERLGVNTVVQGTLDMSTGDQVMEVNSLIRVSSLLVSQDQKYFLCLRNGTHQTTMAYNFQAGGTEQMQYYDTGWNDLAVTVGGSATWKKHTVNNIDWSNQQYDVYHNGTQVGTSLGMQSSATLPDLIRFISAGTGTSSDTFFIDAVFARNWRATEPGFTFGSQETGTSVWGSYWRCLTFQPNTSGGYMGASDIEFMEGSGDSDLCSGGTAISSSQFSTAFLDDYAFDGGTNTEWAASGNGMQYIGYKFANRVSVNHVRWRSRLTGSPFGPTHFDLQYSDDGTNWFTHAYFRNWGGTWGTYAEYLDIGYGTRTTEFDIIGHSFPSGTYAPYTLKAESYFGGFPPYKACDGLTGVSGYWICNGTAGWFEVNLGYPSNTGANAAYVGSYAIQANTIPEPNRAPKDWTVQASNDGTSWGTIDTVTGATSWGSGEIRTYEIDSPGTYAFYKFDVTANNGDASYMVFGELYLYVSVPLDLGVIPIIMHHRQQQLVVG